MYRAVLAMKGHTGHVQSCACYGRSHRPCTELCLLWKVTPAMYRAVLAMDGHTGHVRSCACNGRPHRPCTELCLLWKLTPAMYRAVLSTEGHTGTTHSCTRRPRVCIRWRQSQTTMKSLTHCAESCFLRHSLNIMTKFKEIYLIKYISSYKRSTSPSLLNVWHLCRCG